MRNLITLFCFILITPLSLFSQDTILDKSYGNQGIFDLEILPNHGQLFSGLDKSGRFYFGFHKILDQDSISEFDFRFFRVTEEGEYDPSLSGPEDLGVDLPIVSEFSPLQRSISFKEEYIFAYNGISNNGFPIVDVFTTNKEKIITLDLQFIPSNFYYAALPVRLSNGLFYVFDGTKARRYLDDGSLDLNFGVNGVLDFQAQSNDTLALVPIVQKDGSSGIYFTKLETNSAEEFNLFYSIGKLDLNGDLDLSFGDEGYIEIPHIYGASWVFADNQDEILFTLYHYNEEVFNYGLLKVAKNGTPITAFGNDGYLIDTTSTGGIETFLSFNIPTSKLSDESLLYWSLEYYYNVDSTEVRTEYNLIHYSSNGVINESFGEQGRLKLDFLDNSYIYDVNMDGLDNIYILGFDVVDSLSSSYHNYKLYKLDGEKLFGPRSSTSNPHDFKVIPNPTRNPIRVEYSGPGAEAVEFQLYDAAGKFISKKLFHSILNKESYSLGRVPPYLPSGQYTLRILSKESNLSVAKSVIYIN